MKLPRASWLGALLVLVPAVAAISLAACTVSPADEPAATAGAPPSGTAGSAAGTTPTGVGGSVGVGTAGTPATSAGTGSGGVATVGGASGTAGAAGTSTTAGAAGSTGTAGAGPGGRPSGPSAGCAAPMPLDEPQKAILHDLTVTVADRYKAAYSTRKYYTNLPVNYDHTKKYPMVFYGQGCGQTGPESGPFSGGHFATDVMYVQLIPASVTGQTVVPSNGAAWLLPSRQARYG